METEPMTSNTIFLDGAYAIALSAPNDQYHERAVILAQKLEAEGTRMVTSRAVILEMGNALAKLRYRSAALKLLRSLEDDPNVEILPLSEELYR